MDEEKRDVSRALLVFMAALSILSAQSLQAREVKVPNLARTPPRLGQGYDSRTLKFKQVCVAGTVVYSGQQSAKVDFQNTQSVDAINNTVTAAIKGGVDLVLVAASAQSKLTSVLASRKDTSKYFVSAEVLGKRALLIDWQLNHLGRQAMKTGGIGTFKAICGDRFVTGVDLGMIFGFGVLVQYQDEATKNRLEVTFKIKTPLGSLKKKKSKDWETAEEFAQVAFEMFQVGGDQEFFPMLQKKYQSKTCGTHGLETCFANAEQYLDEILAMARFSSQTELLDYNRDDESKNSVLASYVLDYQQGNLVDLRPSVFLRLRDEIAATIQRQSIKAQEGFQDLLEEKNWIARELEVTSQVIGCRESQRDRC